MGGKNTPKSTKNQQENKQKKKQPTHPLSETYCISISVFILYMKTLNFCGRGIKLNILKSPDF